MKKFFFSHPDITLAIIAFVLLGTLIGIFVWSIDDVVFVIQQSTASQSASGKQGFDLQSAASLNLPPLTSTIENNSPAVAPAAPTTTARTSTVVTPSSPKH